MGNTAGSYNTAVELGHGGTQGHYLMLSGGLPRSIELGSLCHSYTEITALDVVLEGSFDDDDDDDDERMYFNVA